MVAPPEPYRTVSPYLAVPEAEAVAQFAQDLLGAKIVAGPVHDEKDGRLLHMALEIGDSVVLLGCPPDEKYRQTAMLHVYVDDCAAHFAKALELGATEMMPPTEMFYGDRSAGVHDIAGNLWWLAQRLEEPST